MHQARSLEFFLSFAVKQFNSSEVIKILAQVQLIRVSEHQMLQLAPDVSLLHFHYYQTSFWVKQKTYLRSGISITI